MVRAIRGGNRTPNEDTDASSWATVPTDVTAALRDDASVIYVAIFRSNAEAMASILREIAHDNLAQLGIPDEGMAVDNPSDGRVAPAVDGSVNHHPFNVPVEEGRPYDNLRRQSLARDQVAHVANLAAGSSRRRDLHRAQVTHVANVATANAEDSDEYLKLAFQEMAIAQQEHEWRENAQQGILRITNLAREQQAREQVVARNMEHQFCS